MDLPNWFAKKSTITTTDKDFEPAFYPIGTNVSYFGGNGVSREQMLKYFIEVPELFLAISTKAKMFSNMRLDVISKATGKPAPLTHSVQKIIKTPNFHQGQKEFLIQTKIYREIFGNEFLHMLTPIGMSKSVKQINSLNPAYLKIDPMVKIESKPLFLMDKRPEFNYIYTLNGQQYDIPNSDILTINNASIGNNLIGMSAVSSLEPVLENIKAALESRGTLIKNRGALGILSNASTDGMGARGPMLKGEKEQLQKDYRKYGLTKGQWQLIITNLSLNYQKIAMSPKDLMIFEENEADFQTILGAYGLKREMFPSVKGATFENQKQAIKSAYTDTIIPEATEWVSALNNYFGLTGGAFEIVADFSHLPIFKEDMKEKGVAARNYIAAASQALADNGITTEEYSKYVKEFL